MFANIRQIKQQTNSEAITTKLVQNYNYKKTSSDTHFLNRLIKRWKNEAANEINNEMSYLPSENKQSAV